MSARVREGLYHAVLWLVSLVFFAPVFWIALSSFKTAPQILAVPPILFFRPTFANYTRLFADPAFEHHFFNSVVLSVLAVLIAVTVSFLAAFSFSRFRPAATNFLMFLLLSIRMLPGSAAILPVYLMYVAFGWKDNFVAMTLFYAMFSIPFSVWILKGFIDGVSPRFDETGIVNGASWFGIIAKLTLPQVYPGVVAALIFNFIFVWNEFLFNYIIGGNQHVEHTGAARDKFLPGRWYRLDVPLLAHHDLHPAADPGGLFLPALSVGRDDLRHRPRGGLSPWKADFSRASNSC